MSSEEVKPLNVKPGDPLPDFAMKAWDPRRGECEVSSASLAGNPYVLFYYPEADTPG